MAGEFGLGWMGIVFGWWFKFCGVVSLILLFAIEYINSVHMRWLDTGRRYLRRIVL